MTILSLRNVPIVAAGCLIALAPALATETAAEPPRRDGGGASAPAVVAEAATSQRAASAPNGEARAAATPERPAAVDWNFTPRRKHPGRQR
jgi:hypothetical protein